VTQANKLALAAVLRRRTFLAGSAGAAGLAASGPLARHGWAEDMPKRGGTLRAAFSASPAGFDPAHGPSGMSHVVIVQVYSRLMTIGRDAKPHPELAESYSVSSDGLRYTFKLHDGVLFHNRDPLTAADVKFSFDRLRAKNSGYAYGSQVQTIKSIDVLDPLTVQFQLTERTDPFLVYMAFPGSSIVPKKLVESGHDLSAEPVGSGPFKFVSYEPRTVINFVRNDHYFESGKPYFDAMEYRIISDTTALTDALMTGEVDFSNEVPPQDWSTVRGNSGLKTETLEGSRYYWLLPNNTVSPMNDAKVRQAIGLAIDRKAIVDGTFFGEATPILGGVIPKWNWAYADLHFFDEGPNISRAKQLLAEAGHAQGFTTTMTIASSFPAMMSMAPIIQANLAAIGIKVSIKTMPIPAYWDQVWGPSNFDITTMYWLSPLVDPDDFVGNNYGCGMSINVQKSCSKAMQGMLKEAKTAPTEAARKTAYLKQQQLSLQEMPIVPLVNAWLLMGYTKRLRGFTPLRTGMLVTFKDSWYS